MVLGGGKPLCEDKELEILKQRKLLELKRKLAGKNRETEKGKADPKKILYRFLTPKAAEVLEAAEKQYPQVTPQIINALAEAVLTGRIRKEITGGELLWFLRYIGLNVKIETKIAFLERGKLKTIGDKLKEKM